MLVSLAVSMFRRLKWGGWQMHVMASVKRSLAGTTVIMLGWGLCKTKGSTKRHYRDYRPRIDLALKIG